MYARLVKLIASKRESGAKRMTVERFLELFQQYGLIVLFVVFFLEYMNLPGFPAGVIMPAAGVLVSQSRLSLLGAVSLSVLAGVLGSTVIYFICFVGGSPLAHRFALRHKKVKDFADRCQEYIERRGGWGLALCRLIPVLRTIVSIPAGLLRVPAREFIPWSALGIAVWNTALISFGYVFSHLFIS